MMKAAIYYGTRDIRVEDVPVPTANADNMIARVLYCAICGTDLKIFCVGNPKFKPPVILGHEFVGELVHVGSNVRGFKTGDCVTMATTIPCGDCIYCDKGLGNMCLDAKPISSYYDGAFAEFVEIPREGIKTGCVIKIPDRQDIRRYALCEPLSCAINAQNLIQTGAGDVVVIIGGGPLGAIHAELAKARGATVIISDLSEKRIDLLRGLQNVTTVNGEKHDLGAVISAATHGIGADAAIVCAPAAAAFEQSLNHVRKGGRISFFASLPPGREFLSLNSRTIHYNELHISGASDSRREHVAQAADLISHGAIDCDAIITHQVALDDIAAGLKLMEEQQSLKVLVRPEEGYHD